jgi:hypothetical protein
MINTRDWRATPHLSQHKLDAVIMLSTDNMTQFGVLPFTPAGENEPERFLDHIGVLDDWAKTPTAKARVRLVMGNPADASLYVALSFKLPHKKNLTWTFGDTTEEVQRYHQAHMRFHSDDFEMRFKVLTRPPMRKLSSVAASLSHSEAISWQSVSL